MHYVYSAGMIIWSQEGAALRSYLLLHHAQAGHWDFPKGHIEPGEMKEQAALRELKEETGLESTIMPGFTYSFSYFFTDYQGNNAYKTVYFFIGRVSKKEVILSKEHIGFVWLPYEQAKKQLTYENARVALTVAHDFLDHQHRD